MKHPHEIQQRLVKQFAFWSFQGELIVRGFEGRGSTKQANDLLKAIKALDELWLDEFGPEYIDELLRLAKEYDRMNGFEVDEKVSLSLVHDGGAND